MTRHWRSESFAGCRLLLACTALLCGCSPGPNLNDLQFWNQKNPATPNDDFFVTGKLVQGGASWAWGAGELALLPLTPLPLTEARWKPGSASTEVQLFARDLDEIKQILLIQGILGIGSTSNLSWLLATQVPSQLPNDVVLSANVNLPLDPTMFWGNTTPMGGSAPGGEGSIKAVRVHDHGACSVELPFVVGDDDGGGIFEMVNQKVWDGFVEAIDAKDEPDGAIRHWSHAITYLDHTQGDVTDVRGGFFLDFYYEAIVNEPFVDAPEFWFDYNYRFKLSTEAGFEGILGLVSNYNAGYVEGYDAQSAYDDMTKALGLTLPADFRASSLEQQTQLLSSAFVCSPESKDECGFAASILGDSIEAGVDALGLSPAEENALQLSANGTFDNRPNWRCVPVDPNDAEGQHQCGYVLRAKRLNVHADALELVWFDGKEVDNSAYAFWVALNDPFLGSANISKMCAFAQKFPKEGFYTRSWGLHNAPYQKVVGL